MRDDPGPSDPRSGDLERVYVLRLAGGQHPDRAGRISLYDANSGDRLYFDSLAALLSHLRSQLGADARTSDVQASDLQTDEPHLQS